MKIYTKAGDNGETGLYGGPRVGKDDLRIEAFGTVDELNAVLGLARTSSPPAEIDTHLERIQNDLFDLGAELATPDAKARGTNFIGDVQIKELETAIDQFDANLEPLKTFVLPGGSSTAAWLHVARAVCRRAERRVVTLSRVPTADISPSIVVYLNRLSDLLFVLARAANRMVGIADVKWRKRG
jgi:cob(I)alamin adenosyltransferase